MKQRNTEHPILFSGPMVRAILEGRKTQTRRVVKPQPKNDIDTAAFYAGQKLLALKQYKKISVNEYKEAGSFKATYQPGDTLWVRESFCEPNPGEYLYQADHERGSEMDCIAAGLALEGVRWRPSIHMPRWASRIALLVEDVRVERLRDISEEDAVAEGFVGTPDCGQRTDGVQRPTSAVLAFSKLWNSLNAARGLGWDANPLVFVNKFSVKEVRK